MSKTVGDGAAITMQKESLLQPPPIAATFPLRGAHTLRLARFIG